MLSPSKVEGISCIWVENASTCSVEVASSSNKKEVVSSRCTDVGIKSTEVTGGVGDTSNNVVLDSMNGEETARES